MINNAHTAGELAHLRHLANENGSTLSFLMQIIKDNKLHEGNCVAFTLPKDHGGPFGFISSSLESHCHCWLDKDNRAEEGMGFSYYHIKDAELGTNLAYTNRYNTVKALLEDHPELSNVRSDPNHWSKTYAIVEVKVKPLTESAE